MSECMPAVDPTKTLSSYTGMDIRDINSMLGHVVSSEWKSFYECDENTQRATFKVHLALDLGHTREQHTTLGDNKATWLHPQLKLDTYHKTITMLMDLFFTMKMTKKTA